MDQGQEMNALSESWNGYEKYIAQRCMTLPLAAVYSDKLEVLGAHHVGAIVMIGFGCDAVDVVFGIEARALCYKITCDL